MRGTAPVVKAWTSSAPWYGIWLSRVPWYPETGSKKARGNTAEEKGIDWKVSPEKIGSFSPFYYRPLAAIWGLVWETVITRTEPHRK